MAVARFIVGIDLGTTHTVVASRRLGSSAPIGDTEVFPIPQLVSAGEVAARPLLPSFLYAPVAGETVSDPWGDAPWLIGEQGRTRGQEVPGRLVASAKSWLCHAGVDRTADILPWGLEPGDDTPRVSPVAASARLMRHVRRAWDEAHPEARLEHQQVILTVPASFDQVARELTLRAAREAGLLVRLLEEPQAAFYDYMDRTGVEQLRTLLDQRGESCRVLVCDIGGGTTDLTLILLRRDANDELEVSRIAVGRHLLLGGDNLDLALAHLCEPRLTGGGTRLGPRRFGQLTLACRLAKERLLGADAPHELPVVVSSAGSALVGSTLRTTLTREEVERIVLEGFLAPAPRDAKPVRSRSGLVAFGLPYESDPSITRHVASFVARNLPDSDGPDAILLNGGLFHAVRAAEHLVKVVQSWSEGELQVLAQADPDLAVARGAVAYGVALAGHGLCIGGGAAHGYYVGLEAGTNPRERRAVCVVPRGSKEGERHLIRSRPLALRLGRAVRFDLYASDSHVLHAPGEVVTIDEEQFQPLSPVATTFSTDEEAAPEEVRVALEGELSAIGTLELACVETEPESHASRRFALAFELREGAPPADRPGAPVSFAPPSRSQRAPIKTGGRPYTDAVDAIDRVFGKRRPDVKAREIKDLLRELERLLGARATWSIELTRSLFDELAGRARARRRSPDHERVFWMLGGFCLRPGFGHPGDRRRIKLLSPLFHEGLAFQQEGRGWQQFFIAWRRVAGGLNESLQGEIRTRLDPFLASEDDPIKKPKGFKPQAPDELLELASWLERVPVERRTRLGRWILERTWTDRDPRLWAAMGRLGARVPAYASVHHVLPPRTAERWLDELLREKWDEVASGPVAGFQLARVTNDRARDVSESVREEVARRLERAGARAEWVQAVREYVPVQEADWADRFGEELPVGLRLLDGEAEDA